MLNSGDHGGRDRKQARSRSFDGRYSELSPESGTSPSFTIFNEAKKGHGPCTVEPNQATIRSSATLYSLQSQQNLTEECSSKRHDSITETQTLDQKMHGSYRFQRLAREINLGLDIHSPKEAKKVARRIFDAFSPTTAELLKAYAQNPRYIDQKNVLDFKNNHSIALQNLAYVFSSIQEAEKAFTLFDKDGNGSISPQEMKETVLGLYRDRKSLSASLRDVGSAVGTLDVVFTGCALVVSLLMSLVIFGVAVGPFLVTSMSMILAVA